MIILWLVIQYVTDFRYVGSNINNHVQRSEIKNRIRKQGVLCVGEYYLNEIPCWIIKRISVFQFFTPNIDLQTWNLVNN